MTMYVDVFQFNVEFENIFFQNAKRLTIVASNVKRLHRIKLYNFEETSLSHNLFNDWSQNQQFNLNTQRDDDCQFRSSSINEIIIQLK